MDKRAPYILLVEDDPGIARLEEQRLAGLGYEIKSAADAKEAFAAIGEAAPLLMLLDYSLPGENAIEFVGELKARGGSCPPFILVTGRGGEEVAAETVRAGARDYLVKGPDFLAQLVPVVKRVLAEIETARRLEAAGQALRESEARYRTLYESSRDALMTLFPPDWRFTSGNRSAVAMFGAKSEEDFTSMGPLDVSPEYQPDGELSSVKAKRMIETAMAKGSNFFEWTHKKAGGPDFPATVLLTRIELFGKTGLQATVRDVSEQKRVEAERDGLSKQFLQAQKMEAVGLLAGGIAHDFNNILTAIKGYCSLVTNSLIPEDPNREDMREIMLAADRAATLTHQLLAFSRRQIMAPKVLDLNKTIGDMMRMLRRIIGEDAPLDIKLFPAPCIARFDPGQLEQVIVNLVLNARDAVLKGGEIKLETEILLPPEEFFSARPDLPRGEYVCVKVSDTGCGMTEEVMKRIYEPFFTTKVGTKGTGLGLSTVLGIVKQSGGEIQVKSEPGKGSAFSIYLPLAEVPAPAKDKEKEPEAGLKGSETVLVVEDEESLRRLCVRLLGSGGYEVLSAADGPAAIRLMEERGEPVDLLMTDVVMPGMSGRELAGRVLYTSGYTDNAIVKHGVLEPGIAFIYKPYAADALLQKIRKVLDGPADQAKA